MSQRTFAIILSFLIGAIMAVIFFLIDVPTMPLWKFVIVYIVIARGSALIDKAWNTPEETKNDED